MAKQPMTELELLTTFEPNRRRGKNPIRQGILTALERRRADDGTRPAVITAAGGRSWGYLALQIPRQDLAVIRLRYPDLRSPDREIRNRAMAKFMASPESAPYRVDAGIGKRRPNSRIIVR